MDNTGRRVFLGVERSVTGRVWRDRLDERGNMRALDIVQRHGLSELLARILAGRGVGSEDVDLFLDPTVKKLLPDPHTVTDMEAAASRIADAVVAGESVAIFGDYDVDGATSVALLATFLRDAGIEPLIHIPDRIFEGYGPNVDAIRALKGRGASLLVTVDCGTVSHEPLAEAAKLGLTTVVIDHHQADERLPPAYAVVNPNREDDLSGLGHLAAVGLVFVTLVALTRELRRRGFWNETRPEPDLLGMLDLVALGTVADVVPLRGLNRAFVSKGLIAMRRRERAGLTALMDAARLNGPPEPWHLGFHAGAAHQCRRSHRPRRSRRPSVDAGRSNRGGPHRRRARPPQPRTAGDRAGDPRGGGGRSHGGPGDRREGRRGGDGGGGLAPWRGRPGGGAAQGTVRTARLRDRPRPCRYRHRLGSLHCGCRSRPRRAPGGRQTAS